MLNSSLLLFISLTMFTLSPSKRVNVLGDDFFFDKRVLGEDPQDIYNKTIASKSSTIRNNGIKTSAPAIADTVIHRLNRGSFFTPPLPKDQFNFSFADKPTLRGSNSENIIPNRRPPVLSIIPIPPKEKERIPIKRPDLVAPLDMKKKTINTPSVQRLSEEINYSESSSSSWGPSSTTHNINNTFNVVVPAVHNISFISILRILDNGNNKADFGENKPRLEADVKTSKTYYIVSTFSPSSSSPVTVQEIKQSDLPLYPYSSNNIEEGLSAQKEEQVTESRKFEPPVKSVQESTELNNVTEHSEPPRSKFILGVAWNIYVYLMAFLFVVVTCISAFSLIRIGAFKWLLPCCYFVTVHGLLAVIGTIRSVYLFYYAYNSNRYLSRPIGRFMLNAVFPFLICIFTLFFLFILNAVDLKPECYYTRKSGVLLPLVLIYTLCSVCVDLYTDALPHPSAAMLLSQVCFIFLCIFLSSAYIAFYKFANRSTLRKQNSVYGTAFTHPVRPSLAHAIRVMLAISLLLPLMATIQVIGIFCGHDPMNEELLHPWLAWAFHLSIRVIEVSICFLFVWAAVQPLRGDDEKESHNSASGFPLFAWGSSGTPRGSDHGAGDDIYPNICCNANQAVHNYTLRMGKPVYEDVLHYYNVPAIATSSHEPPALFSHTIERRSFESRRPTLQIEQNTKAVCGTLPIRYSEGRAQNSPSMLIDEKGIVRFRSIADTEFHHDEDVSTYSRIDPSHPNDNYNSS